MPVSVFRSGGVGRAPGARPCDLMSEKEIVIKGGQRASYEGYACGRDSRRPTITACAREGEECWYGSTPKGPRPIPGGTLTARTARTPRSKGSSVSAIGDARGS